MSERGQHTLSFRVPNLAPRKVACTTCGRQMTRQEWAASTCPGTPTDQEEAQVIR